ncbi:MAG: NlpC/P60 family protein [Frankiaceae bacterium]
MATSHRRSCPSRTFRPLPALSALPARRARSLALTGATLAALTAGIGAAAPTAGHATPRPSIASVQSRVDRLTARLDQAVEDYDQAKVDLAATRQRARVAQQRVAAAQHRLTQVRGELSAVAAAAYRGATTGGGVLSSLVGATDPQQFVDQAATLDAIGRNQAAALAGVTAAEHDLAVAQRAADDDLAAARALVATVGERKGLIQRTLASQRGLLGKLKGRQRARLAAAARAERARQHDLARAALGAGGSAPAVSGSAGVAVQWAYRELGRPYAWGATGPGAFDCSGLTMYVWGRAGASLPHSSAAQHGAGAPVSRGALRPGDLVFFGSPIHHVGIYIGNGSMIEAPHTGSVVRVASIDRSDYVGAVRP